MRLITSAFLVAAVLLVACDSKPAEKETPAATSSETQKPDGATSEAATGKTQTVTVAIGGMT